jgi:transposase InsO family protein
MAWKVRDLMSQRKDFVMLALQSDANIRQLCRRFGITAKTGYKWIKRCEAEGMVCFEDRSRRPRNSPGRTPPEVEQRVVGLRDEHPAWGGRKIRRYLQNQGQRDVPASSTITDILHRHGRIDPAESVKHKPLERFEHPYPNDLWQMDFKGHFATQSGRCHPLTVMDDHSRFAVGLRACANETTETVRGCLTSLFRLYGLPRCMLMDNGSPWGSDHEHRWTPLTAWLVHLGVFVSHSRPWHPQTQGKDERFHRTLKAEVLRFEQFKDLAHAQNRFDIWRDVYNHERPHEALAMATPATRYRPSPRSFPEVLPVIEYGPTDVVRKVQDKGFISYRGRSWRLPKAFRGYPVALRPTACDGQLNVFFCNQRIGKIDLRLGYTDVKSFDQEHQFFPR